MVTMEWEGSHSQWLELHMKTNLVWGQPYMNQKTPDIQIVNKEITTQMTQANTKCVKVHTINTNQHHLRLQNDAKQIYHSLD